MSSPLAWLGPPVIGGFIGYLTNRIAIRMLFRPLRPWYVFGLRVPMTPGVIPAKRHQLAANIGAMVGGHLLTVQDIGHALSNEPFQDHLHNLLQTQVEELLDRDLGPVDTLVPRRFQAYLRVSRRQIKYRLRRAVRGYLQSPSFAEALAQIIGRLPQEMAGIPVERVASTAIRQQGYRLVDHLVRHLLGHPGLHGWLADYLYSSLQKAVAEEKTVADCLPPGAQQPLVDALGAQAPFLLEQIGLLIAEPLVQERIIQAVREGVDHFLESLGAVGAMARGFFDVALLEEKIRAYLEANQGKLASWLQTEEVQERLAALLQQKAAQFFATPVARLTAGKDAGELKEICCQGSDLLLAMAQSHGFRQGLSRLVTTQMEALVDHGRRPLDELVAQLHLAEVLDREELLATCLALFRSRQVNTLLGQVAGDLVDILLNRPIGRLHPLVPYRVRQQVVAFLVQQVNRILLREVPGLVATLNIKEMVTSKVDSLDLLRLEGLLLSIMEEQFHYINLFGGLLGFLIGLLNLIVLGLI